MDKIVFIIIPIIVNYMYMWECVNIFIIKISTIIIKLSTINKHIFRNVFQLRCLCIVFWGQWP